MLAFVLLAVALVLVFPQVDLPYAVNLNRNSAALVGRSLAPHGTVSVRDVLPHLLLALPGFHSQMSPVGHTVLSPEIAPALDLLCALRC